MFLRKFSTFYYSSTVKAKNSWRSAGQVFNFSFVKRLSLLKVSRHRSRWSEPILELPSAKRANVLRKFSTFYYSSTVKAKNSWRSAGQVFNFSLFKKLSLFKVSRHRSGWSEPILKLPSAKRANVFEKIFNFLWLLHSESKKILKIRRPSVQFFFFQKTFSFQGF